MPLYDVLHLAGLSSAHVEPAVGATSHRLRRLAGATCSVRTIMPRLRDGEGHVVPPAMDATSTMSKPSFSLMVYLQGVVGLPQPSSLGKKRAGSGRAAVCQQSPRRRIPTDTSGATAALRGPDGTTRGALTRATQGPDSSSVILCMFIPLAHRTTWVTWDGVNLEQARTLKHQTSAFVPQLHGRVETCSIGACRSF
jgi:hypothetical protein